MAYLLKQHCTVRDINNEQHVHDKGTVLSDWEVHDFIREKIKEGSDWYRERFEPLTSSEAHSYRVKATEAQERRDPATGEVVPPPWDDYVGLHPIEIVERMRESDSKKVEEAKRYERAIGGMSRRPILDFVSATQREPWEGYDQLDVRQIIEHFSVIPDRSVEDAIRYEREHKNRPAIVEYDREVYEGQSQTMVAS